MWPLPVPHPSLPSSRPLIVPSHGAGRRGTARRREIPHPHPLAPRSNPRRARAPPPRSRVATTPSRRGVPLARLPLLLLLLRPITSPPRPLRRPVALPHSRSPRTTILRSGGSHVFHARRKAAESQRPFSPWPPTLAVSLAHALLIKAQRPFARRGEEKCTTREVAGGSGSL